jgi:hypothetical protein
MKWQYKPYQSYSASKLRFIDVEGVPNIYEYNRELKIRGLHRLDLEGGIDTTYGIMYDGTLTNFELEKSYQTTGLKYYYEMAHTSFRELSLEKFWDQAMSKMLETGDTVSFLFKGYWYMVKEENQLYMHIGDWQFKRVVASFSEVELPIPCFIHAKVSLLHEEARRAPSALSSNITPALKQEALTDVLMTGSIIGFWY